MEKRTEIQTNKIFRVHTEMLKSPNNLMGNIEETAYRIPPNLIHMLESATNHEFGVYLYINDDDILNIDVIKRIEIDDPEVLQALNDKR